MRHVIGRFPSFKSVTSQILTHDSYLLVNDHSRGKKRYSALSVLCGGSLMTYFEYLEKQTIDAKIFKMKKGETKMLLYSFHTA
jgi:hypothetical protein